MSRPARSRPSGKREVDDYRHDEAQRLNNPEAGLARYETEKPPTRRYEYDPRMDPQLVWAGKAERTSFEVDAVSIHVHERLSTEAIVRTLRKEQPQLALFGDPELDRDREVEFYQHEVDWTNRLVLGDSLVVMTSLLERERMAGQVQCIYFDPPYGINYNSNFQARISSRSPQDSDEALTREPEQVQAYRDTWTLREHSYLTYLRDRLLVARELLSDSGSIFVQIGEDNLHRIRLLLDEVFGAQNAVATITIQKTGGLGTRLLTVISDYIVWFAKDRERVKYRQLYRPRDERTPDPELEKYDRVELPDGSRRALSPEEASDPSLLPPGARRFQLVSLTSQGFRRNTTVDYTFKGITYHPGPNACWKTTVEGLDRLAQRGRLQPTSRSLRYVRFADDLPARALNNIWADTGAGIVSGKRYVVQTQPKIIARCLLMSTDPGDLVLDPTGGSGTTAYVAEQYGRRWITCDTSRVAISLARERLLTATFPFYVLQDKSRGIDGGLEHKKIHRLTLRSAAYGEAPDEVHLYDQPEVDTSKVRVSGPFTVEALSRYAINPLQDGVPPDPAELTATADHIDALLDALKVRGVPVKGGPDVGIATLSRLAGTDPLHAEGTTEDGTRFAVSVGPRYGPITRGQVDDALDNAYGYELVVFAGFTATAEVQTFLGKGRAGRYKVVLLEANADLLVADLLKNTKASQTFRLFAAPDVAALPHTDGGVYVELRGVDVYDAGKGEATARTLNDIAAWFLDHDYDGEVFHVNQAFFPKTNAWDALARALKGTLDEEALAKLAEFQSNPFTPGEHHRAAVRVIDDSGQTSEAVVSLDV
jgi:adenine-specific DNA-methyltransferase